MGPLPTGRDVRWPASRHTLPCAREAEDRSLRFGSVRTAHRLSSDADLVSKTHQPPPDCRNYSMRAVVGVQLGDDGTYVILDGPLSQV
jgi:hypothetical protein